MVLFWLNPWKKLLGSFPIQASLLNPHFLLSPLVLCMLYSYQPTFCHLEPLLGDSKNIPACCMWTTGRAQSWQRKRNKTHQGWCVWATKLTIEWLEIFRIIIECFYCCYSSLFNSLLHLFQLHPNGTIATGWFDPTLSHNSLNTAFFISEIKERKTTEIVIGFF